MLLILKVLIFFTMQLISLPGKAYDSSFEGNLIPLTKECLSQD